MAEYIYTGPVSKQLRGNREAARTLEREARVKVGYLFDSMAPGQTFKSGSWNVGNGYRILAFVWNDATGKRATVRLAGPGGEESEYTIKFAMENGWITEHEGVYTVYVWNDIIEHAFGVNLEYTFTESDKCKYTTGSFNIIDPPELDANNGYTSTIDDRDDPTLYSEFNPCKYSGLARLYMQAKRGANKKFREDFTGDYLVFSAGPGELGIIRSPAGNYYAINASQTKGVIAVKLSSINTVACLAKASAEAYEEPQLTRNVTDAIVLANMMPTGPVLTLLDPAESANFFAYTLSTEEPWNLNTLAWGWNWRYQKRGGVDEFLPEAIKIGYCAYGVGPAYRVKSRQSKLTFTWGSDNGMEVLVAAYIDNGPDYSFLPGGANRILTCSETSTYWEIVPPSSAGGETLLAQGEILAWYDSAGDLNTISFDGTVAGTTGYDKTTEGPNYDPLPEELVVGTCASPNSSNTWGYSITTLPFWVISKPPTLQIRYTSEYENYIELKASVGANEPFGFASNPSSFMQCNGTQELGYFKKGDPNPNVGWVAKGDLEMLTSGHSVVDTPGSIHVLVSNTPGIVWWIVGSSSMELTKYTRVGNVPGQTLDSGGLATEDGGPGPTGHVSYPMSKFYDSPSYTTLDQDTVNIANRDLVGYALFDTEQVVLPQAEAERIGYLCTLPSVTDREYPEGASAFVSYGGEYLVTGLPIPDGMSEYGSTQPGLFIGGV